MARLARAVAPGVPHHITDAATAVSRCSSALRTTLGTADFVAKLEHDLGRTLGRRKPGRKAKAATLDQAELL
jgi:hypothetical protein